VSMNDLEVAEVLDHISRHDRRNLGDTDADIARMIDEWGRMIGHNDYTDAMNAVIQHKATSTEYLQPAHINTICKAKREARAAEKAHMALTPPNRADFPTMPKAILDELSAAWNDPVAYAKAEYRWNESLRAQGFTEVNGTWKRLPPLPPRDTTTGGGAGA